MPGLMLLPTRAHSCLIYIHIIDFITNRTLILVVDFHHFYLLLSVLL